MPVVSRKALVVEVVEDQDGDFEMLMTTVEIDLLF